MKNFRPAHILKIPKKCIKTRVESLPSRQVNRVFYSLKFEKYSQYRGTESLCGLVCTFYLLVCITIWQWLGKKRESEEEARKKGA